MRPNFEHEPLPPLRPSRIAGESEPDFKARFYVFEKELRQFDELLRAYNTQVAALDKWLAWAGQMHAFVGNPSTMMQCERCYGWYDDYRHLV